MYVPHPTNNNSYRGKRPKRKERQKGIQTPIYFQKHIYIIHIIVQKEMKQKYWSLKLNFHLLRRKLTIDCNDNVGEEKHKNDKQKPDNHLGNPSTMMPGIPSVILIFYSNHYKGKCHEKQEIPQAHTKNRFRLIPLLGVSLWRAYPCKDQNHIKNQIYNISQASHWTSVTHTHYSLSLSENNQIPIMWISGYTC